MPTTETKKTDENKKTAPYSKTAAIIGLVGAIFIVAVAYYPPLLPVCQALSFCQQTPEVTTE
jgi:hypothetical protein